MSLHAVRDEHDRVAPIVSVSLGLPATFLWCGLARTDQPQRVALDDGNVVWGGSARMTFHGVAPIKAGVWPERRNIAVRRTGRLDAADQGRCP